MEESPSGSALVYSLLVVGWLLVVIPMIRVLSRQLNMQAFKETLEKLLRTGNIDRASKLTRAAEYPVLVAARAVLEALQTGGALPQKSDGDYRSGAVDQSPESVSRLLREKFVAAYDAREGAFRFDPIAGAAGVVCLIAAGVQTVREEASLSLCAIAGAGVLVFFNSLRIPWKQRREAMALFEDLSEMFYAIAVNPNASAPSTPAPAGWGQVAVLVPEQPARTVQLTKNVIKIGRLESADVQVNHESVSRLHAVIEYDENEGTVVLIDLGSASGTKVNDTLINRHELRNGDRISIGEGTLVFALHPQPPTPSP